jgi:hypothetical protein
MRHPILKVSFLFGLACGVVAFSFFLFLYFKGKDALGDARAADLFSSFLFVVASIWYFKKVVRRGWLHFWEGLSVGFLTNLIGALVSATLIQVFITQVDSHVLPKHVQVLEQMMLQHQKDYVELAGEENFRQQLEQTRLTPPIAMFWDELMRKVLFIGVFPVLLISAFFRRQTYSLINPGETPIRPPVKKAQ